MADLTDNPTEVANWYKEQLEQSGLFKAVYYGDQSVMVKTPLCAVIPGPISSDGQTNRLDHTITIFFLIYHGKIQDTQDTAFDCDRLAEQARDYVHKFPQADGRVIHGWISSMEPGFGLRSETLQRMHRLTWTGLTRTYNPFGG